MPSNNNSFVNCSKNRSGKSILRDNDSFIQRLFSIRSLETLSISWWSIYRSRATKFLTFNLQRSNKVVQNWNFTRVQPPKAIDKSYTRTCFERVIKKEKINRKIEEGEKGRSQLVILAREIARACSLRSTCANKTQPIRLRGRMFPYRGISSPFDSF